MTDSNLRPARIGPEELTSSVGGDDRAKDCRLVTGTYTAPGVGDLSPRAQTPSERPLYPDHIEFAAGLADRGWPILPIFKGSKKPAHKERSVLPNHEDFWLTSADAVREFWDTSWDVKTGQQCQFAVMPGIHGTDGFALVAIDVDGDVDGLTELLADAGPASAMWSRSTAKVQRPDAPDRWHLWGITRDTDLPSTAYLTPHLEWRASPGYVMLPGSLHPDGEHYVVVQGRGRGQGGMGWLPLTLPGALLEAVRRLRSSEAPKAVRASSRSSRAITPGPLSARAQRYLDTAVQGVLNDLDVLPSPWYTGAGWDRGTYKAAMRLVELGNALGDLDTVHNSFLDHAPSDSRWNGAETKWANALRTVGDRCAELPDNEYEGLEITFTNGKAEGAAVVEGSEVTVSEEEPVRESPFQVLDLAPLVAPDRPPRRWLWDQVIPEGEHISLIAPSGVGKSLLALALAVAAASGKKQFIGRDLHLEEGHRVLFIDMENGEDDWAERLVDLGVTPENVGALMVRLHVLSMPPLRGLDTQNGASQLMGILDTLGLTEGDVVILDSTQRLTAGEENSNDTIRAMYLYTSVELKRRRLTVIRTDNTGHTGGHARGASAKRDDVGMAWLLTPDEKIPDVFMLASAKRRPKRKDGKDNGVLTFKRETVDGLLSFTPASGTSYGDVMTDARALLARYGVPVETGQRAAWELVKDAPERSEHLTSRVVQEAQKGRFEITLVDHE